MTSVQTCDTNYCRTDKAYATAEIGKTGEAMLPSVGEKTKILCWAPDERKGRELEIENANDSRHHARSVCMLHQRFLEGTYKDV